MKYILTDKLCSMHQKNLSRLSDSNRDSQRGKRGHLGAERAWATKKTTPTCQSWVKEGAASNETSIDQYATRKSLRKLKIGRGRKPLGRRHSNRDRRSGKQ